MAFKRRQYLALALVPLALAIMSWSGALRRARDGVSDLLFTSRRIPASVVIVAIDERSIHSIGQWPWPRATFGAAISRLGSGLAIGIDVNFKEPSRLGAADDLTFAIALQTSKIPVILASELQSDGTIIRPIPILASESLQGLANVSVDPDGIVRTINLLRAWSPSFGSQLADTAGKHFLRPEPVRINYLGPGGTVPVYSFVDVMNGTVNADAFSGRIVLIGATANDLQDYQNTPMGLMSGVEIQSNVVANILADDFLRTSRAADVLVTLASGVIALTVSLNLRRTLAIVGVSAAVIATIWIVIFLMFERGILLDLVMPTIAVAASGASGVLARYAATASEHKFIHDTFSRYLAPQVVAELLRDPSRVRLGGQRRELTILFSDIRGFTTLSETMSAQDLGQFLNRYLGAMTDIVLERHGVIDKYIGDAIMAFWGAPLDDERHALNGVQTALAMVAGLERFNAESEVRGKPPIAVGIGLNAGMVTVGNMGSERRFDYTVIGDEVNLASRLEGLTRTYGVSIIISANVLGRITPEDRAAHGIVTREIDRVRVKGKTKPVTVYQVMPPDVAARVVPQLELHERGLAHYYAGRWQEAIATLEKFTAAVGADGPSTLISERCQEFITKSPERWDGVYEMHHK